MGSIFASATQTTIPIPMDPPNEATIRKLTGREYELAQEAHARGIAVGRPRVWHQKFKRILVIGSDAATAEAVTEAIAEPLTGFDRFVVIRFGLVSWSYDRTKDDNGKRPRPEKSVKEERAKAIDDLDDEAADYLAREILRLTKPGLFETVEEEGEERRKNG